MIRNIVLDMGNVLLTYDPQVSLDAFCSSEEEKALIRRELFEASEWILGDLGAIRDGDRYDLIKDRIPPESWEALKSCCDRWDICMEPIPGAESFCREMKKKGYGVYVLSNASDAFYRYFPRLLPFSFFDGILVSADEHVIKPDPAIYRLLLDRYGLKPEECLFIDDTPRNVEGARAVGMQATQFQNDYDRIREEFQL